MRYSEKLEALKFAIGCTDADHLEHISVGHDLHGEACWCTHGITIRRLLDEIKTTQCAIESVAKRTPKGGRS